MDDILTLALAVGGTVLFSAIGLPAGIGWFVGMTTGQLLSLESETNESTTVGPRRTEFRGLSSKFGVPISKGYGTVRLNGNIIWTSAVTETLHNERNCISQQVGGFFGLFDKEQKTCNNILTYHYSQSFAIAFAQGPATDIVRVWAAGNLIFNNSDSNVRQDATDAAASGRDVSTAQPVDYVQEVQLSEFMTVTATPTMRFHLGTSTQGADISISEDVGAANCPGFRNTVYIVFEQLDLERWGYRIPEITAEITFTGTASYPVHVKRNLIEGYSQNWSRWSSEVDPAGSTIINQGINDQLTDYGFIDVYQGDLYRVLDWEPILEEVLGYSVSPTSGGLNMGKFDGNGMLYWSSCAVGFCAPVLIQYDPVKGAVQQVDTGAVTGSWWMSHAIYDEVRGLGFGVSSILGRFFVFVIDRATYALNNNLSVPEDDATVEFFQSVFPATAIGASGAMCFDKEGKVYIGTSNGLYRYDPDINTLTLIGQLTEVGESPASDTLDIVGLTYSWLDDSIVLLSNNSSPNVGDLVIKWDIATETVTASSREFDAWSTDQPQNWYRGPYEGGQYIYSAGVGIYERLDVITLEVVSFSGGLWDSLATPLSGIYIPQTRSMFNGTVRFDYFRGSTAGTTLDAVVSDLVLKDDVLEDRYGITASDIDVTDLAGTTVRGYAITSQQSIRGALVPLQQGYFFDYVESDAQLVFRLRGRSSIVTITEDDLAAHEHGSSAVERLKVTYREELELPRELAVNYIDKNRNYEQSTQRFRRLKTNASSNTTITLPIVFTGNEAQAIVETLHTDAWVEREIFNFSLGPKYMYLDPTDNITITLDDGSSHFMRLTKTVIGRNGIVLCEGVADRASLYTMPNAVGNEGSYTEAPFLHVPQTIGVFTPALPPLTVTNDDYALYVGVTGYDPNSQFEAVDVYVATPGSALNFVGSIDSLAASGSIDTELEHPDNPAGFYGSIDSGQTISLVTAPIDAPSTITEDQLFDGDNDAVLGDEIIAFQTVSSDSPDTGVYTLSNIIRGLNGTDHAVDRHIFPEPFILLSSLLRIPLSENDLNEAISIVIKSKGSNAQTLEVIEYQGSSAAPLAPTDPQATSSGSPEDYVFTWTRRDRIYGAWSDTGTILNSEATEDYELDIMDRDGTVLRTLDGITDVTTVTYTNANMVTDFSTVPETIYGILYQISATVGRGFPRRFVTRPDGGYYFRNFISDLASPVTTPANTTQRWVTSGYTYNVEADATSDYAASLHLNASVDGRHLVSFEDAGEMRDVEMLIRFKVTAYGAASAGAGPRFIFRGRGTAADEKGFFLGINADGSDFGLYKYNEGTSVQIGSTVDISDLPHLAGHNNGDLEDNVWYRCRLRASGWRYKFKIWRDDKVEPGVWDAEFYDSMTHEYGWVGVGGFELYVDTKIDWIYFAVNGKRAG